MRFTEPATLGRLKLKNRFFMAPVKTAYGTLDGRVTERHLVYYRNIAKGGAALVIPEPVSVVQTGKEHPKQLTIHLETSVPDLKKIVAILHENGALACLNLNHAGRAANPKATGTAPLAPSALVCPVTGQIPNVLSPMEIEEIIHAFGDAVGRAAAAGFDAVEIQCGHGYLVSQFLSPRTNQREDEYGRDKSLFLKKVFEEVERNRGDLTVLARISVSEFLEGGLMPEDNLPVLKLAEKHGFDAVHCGMGSICDTPPFYYAHMGIPESHQLEALRKVRRMTSLPLIAAGRMADIEKLETLERENLADFAAFGRALVADPALPAKLTEGKTEAIVFCGFCLQGCLANVKNGSGLGCIVNPEIDKVPLNPAGLKGKKAAVIGAGPAGLSAACTLAKQGADVTVFEKTGELGGQFRLAPLAPHKELMRRPLQGLINRARRLVSDIRLNAEPADEDLKAYDFIIAATGSRQRIAGIKNLETQYWMTSLEFFENKKAVKGKRVLIVGAGMVGMEAAEVLVGRGFEVTATKRSNTIANDMEMITKKMMLKRLGKTPRMTIMPETTVLSFEKNGVRVRCREKEKTLPAFNTVIIASGMEPDNSLAVSLKTAGFPVMVIGDANHPADIYAATRAGYETAVSLR
ncbi:MAG: FAD-dependent oxidoreductase [Acidobacteria bacterium]|nr:FAD-dependent oxidoreductase [Acidobacteriota bacterium]